MPRSPLFLPALIGCAVCLGSGHVFARLAFGHGVNLLTAALFRAGCASLILAGLLVARNILPAVTQRALIGTVVLGAFVVGQTLLIQVAVKLLPVTVALLLFYTYPILVAIVSAILGEHRVSPRLFAALIAAFAGLVMVLGVSPEGTNLSGVFAALGAAMVFTGTLVLTPRLAPDVAAPLRTFLMMAAATAMLGVVAGGSGNIVMPQGATAWQGLAGLSLFYGAGIVGLFLLLPHVGPVQAAVVLNLEPVFVALVAWAMLGETLAPLQMVGAGLVVAAVMSTQVGHKS